MSMLSRFVRSSWCVGFVFLWVCVMPQTARRAGPFEGRSPYRHRFGIGNPLFNFSAKQLQARISSHHSRLQMGDGFCDYAQPFEDWYSGPFAGPFFYRWVFDGWVLAGSRFYGSANACAFSAIGDPV
jgi:hypothetical protein